MSGVKWGIAALVVLALVSGGCRKQTVGPTVGEYQKQRAAMIEKNKARAKGEAPVQVAKAGEA